MIGFGSYLVDYLEYEGISQSDFAFRLGISKKHLNEIINGKSNMSSDLMYAIATLTGIDINFIAAIENKKKVTEDCIKDFGSEEALNNYLNEFKPLEIKKRKWINFRDEKNVLEKAYDILQYLKYSNFDVVKKSKERILFKENGDSIELLSLWLARCDHLAELQIVNEYHKENLPIIIKEINNYCFENNSFNFETIKNILNKYGIYFVIEDALPSTIVRGAFKVFKNKPAIYLTRYYKRQDGIVFALYHELGHAKSDFNQGKAKVIIDGNDVQEKRADNFATNAMISKEDFHIILKNVDSHIKVKQYSESKKIPMSFIVGRLAKEGIINYNDSFYLNNIVRI